MILQNQLNGHKHERTERLLLFTLMVLVISFILMGQAHAGTGGTEFDDVWTTLTDWTQGTLGRVISGASIVIGAIAGMGRGSLMGFASGIGIGVGLYNAPTVVEAIMTATLDKAIMVSQIVHFSNGLVQ